VRLFDGSGIAGAEADRFARMPGRGAV